jgi:hypothetical protein
MRGGGRKIKHKIKIKKYFKIIFKKFFNRNAINIYRAGYFADRKSIENP